MPPENQNTRYDFFEVEPRISKMWKEAHCFQSAQDSKGNILDKIKIKATPFTIAIPPPNVTGRLHMGHALNNTIQDILIRFKRMDGFDALWIPGTDHAGIATQTVVKKMLDEDGIDYRELGREKFVEKIWEWKNKYGDFILKQLEKMGCSCDWSRTRFTMDEGLSQAVRKFFKTLSDDGLIYRGKRIVNWCPMDRTALSDDEVDMTPEKGFLWHIKYPLADGSGHLIVATTRPETLFGDVAVAVNPKDKRFQKFIGKEVIVPLQERRVPVIADDYVDMEFGTGCLKITPAHDANDFEVGARHNLKPINVMNEDATMNEIVPKPYQGLDRYKCREKAIAELKEKNLLEKEEERMTPIVRSYRSKAAIEYRLSDQWFVKMKPLAEKVLALHQNLNFFPKRWEKVYLDWIQNIRDWCISRQIWWGHRIPAWYCDNSAKCPPIISLEIPLQCPHCGSTNLTQDTDVLDTWFSSALWPLSTLGWPENTKDFERYFPTSTLATAKDIIFFWVARMNMAAAHLTGKLPYQNVYIHPVVLDEKGETMSKSKGNGIDPLVVIEGATLKELEQPVREARPPNMKEILKRVEKNFSNGFEAVGADALRYTLIYLCSSGQQLKLSLKGFQDLGRRFTTKLWNAARFLMMYIEQEEQKGGEVPKDFSKHLQDEDLWIQASFQKTTNKIRQMLETYDFTNLGETYYHFVWSDFCDWYIELCKVRLTSDNAIQRKTALHSLITVFAETLKLLHPLIPFLTEELWQRLVPLAEKFELWGDRKPKERFLMLSEFPKTQTLSEEKNEILERFSILQNIVTSVRTLRKTYQIKESEKLSAMILPANETTRRLAQNSSATVCRLSQLKEFQIANSKKDKPKKTITILEENFEIYLDVSASIDVEKEKARLGKDIEKLKAEISNLDKRLNNQDFVKNAAQEIVQEQQEKLKTSQDKLGKTEALFEDLKTWDKN